MLISVTRHNHSKATVDGTRQDNLMPVDLSEHHVILTIFTQLSKYS